MPTVSLDHRTSDPMAKNWGPLHSLFGLDSFARPTHKRKEKKSTNQTSKPICLHLLVFMEDITNDTNKNSIVLKTGHLKLHYAIIMLTVPTISLALFWCIHFKFHLFLHYPTNLYHSAQYLEDTQHLLKKILQSIQLI